MNGTNPSEYQKLALDSSNEMMAYDSRWVLGRYSEAAWHALQAGHGRRLMGILMRDEGRSGQAAADWVSATACFLLATQHSLAASGLEEVRELDRAGHIPPERQDIHADLEECETKLNALNQRITSFLEEYGQRFSGIPGTSANKLNFLLASVREFPGLAILHFAIYRQALALGDAVLAAEHLRWAAEFGPDKAEYVGRYGYHLITAGRSDLAAEIAQRFLSKHPDQTTIRVLLAQALVSRGGRHTPDPETALNMLRDVACDPNADVYIRLAALALSGAIHHDRGEQTETNRLVAQFDLLSEDGSTNAARIAPIRKMLTTFSNNGGGPPAEGLETSLAEPFQFELFWREEEMTVGNLSGEKVFADY